MSWPKDSLDVRFDAARILIPLILLGFFSSRIPHVTEWIGESGFNVPDLGGHWAQPLYIPPVPDWIAILIGAGLVLSLLMVAFGKRVVLAGSVAIALLVYVALADRLAAFTVSKISAVLMLTVVYAFYERSQGRQAHGSLKFFQAFLVVFYAASGICKYEGDWTTHTHLIWTHLHSSYETTLSYYVGRYTPTWAWQWMQTTTLIFEMGAPIWFYFDRTRPFAIAFGVAMHAAIGLLFGPVIWFSLLMITLILVAFGPEKMWESLSGFIKARFPTTQESAPTGSD